MCGFVGIIDRLGYGNKVYKEKIEIMLKKISHRGPDEQKFFIDEEESIYLGFARLSMIDLKDSSQPFYDKTTGYIILFNGEIYNFKLLKAMLLQHGYSFNTHGEVEVILKMFLEYDEDFVKYLDGMFAICIINTRTKDIRFFRDRFGIKPLYYSVTSEYIVFASELKGVMPLSGKELDYRAVELYLSYRFIPSPFSIIKGVSKLCPGEYIYVDQVGEKHKFFNLYNQTFAQVPFCNEQFVSLIRESICSTFESSDVPLGLFLSGGLDSGIIATYLKDFLKSNIYHITYCDDSEKSELAVVNELAKELNIVPQKLVLDTAVILDYMDNVLYYIDEPMYSSVSISTFHFAKAASHNIKGVLTGDGSDELVFGYGYLRDAISSNQKVYENYFNGIGWLKGIDKSEILIKQTVSQYDIEDILLLNCKVENNIVETLRRVELYKRLADYHLMRVDKLTMAVGVEARLPFLRNSYVDYMLKISPEIFLGVKDAKGLLKQAIGKDLPNALFHIEKKPFNAPIKNWIESVLKNDIYRLLHDKYIIEAVQLNYNKVNQILAEYDGSYKSVSNVWGIYLLLKWYNSNIL